MLFNSLHFLAFFPIVVIGYFLLPQKFRWVLLLAASYYFYMAWKAEYIVLILASTCVDFYAGRKMAGLPDKKARKPWLYLSLAANLGLLFTFKYFNFFVGEAEKFAHFLGMDYAAPALKVILPMGISFYTFQTLSYSLDIYHGKLKPERHFGIFALFVTFFPQLVAGPIERASHLLPQFREKHRFNYDDVVMGLNKIFYGLFKKVVVADRLGIYVNDLFGQAPTALSEGVPSTIESASSISIMLGTFFFALQIYCDFSGYSDIAIGTARILGFRLMENFRRPYLSQSIAEFWRRWHISLSTWFRDYVYIPLGGNRVVKWRWYYNLMITFVVSGVWHGANWTFVAWGALHGGYMVLGLLLARPRNGIAGILGLKEGQKINTALKLIMTFVLVCLAWVFFRAVDVQDATLALQKMVFFDFNLSLGAMVGKSGIYNFLLTLMMVGLLGISYLMPYNLKIKYPQLLYVVVIILMIFFGTDGKEFIYFQF